ncbi:AMP-binding enzyme [Aspergillus luchuensis]|uniref:AMP-binding enzyme n=1 Tax=Aspergillus kawachii TaxID=1069201 RepID=A0A146FNY5_ASPKA|nr:AMP-binding enzyme [Aspergillus luchuensis]
MRFSGIHIFRKAYVALYVRYRRGSNSKTDEICIQPTYKWEEFEECGNAFA